MNTFVVSSVTAEKAQLPTRDAKALIEQRGLRGIEAISPLPSRFIECEPYHGFVMAVHTAYAKHYPLVLSPDHIWLLLSQGLARHINENAEKLRGRFVRHQGQLNLTVRRDEFRPKDPNNDWPGVFTELSGMIKEHVGNRRDLFLCDFSTTDFIARAASEVVLLGAVQQYFTYTVMSLCGIPSITLLGTPSDWQSIQRRVEALAEFDLEWWVDVLRPIVAQFEAASRGEVDQDFWQEMYKLHNASGGEQITGWMTCLFPYLKDTGNQPNPFIERWRPKGFFQKLFSKKDENAFERGPKVSDFPCGITQAPFIWNLLGEEHPMSFAAGFFGASQDKDGLHPQLGWAVTESLGSGDFDVQIAGEKYQVSPKKSASSLNGILTATKSLPPVTINIWFSNELLSLDGLAGAKNIASVEILSAAKLHDISALREVPYLQKLRIQQCDALTSIAVVAELTELRELAFTHCNNLHDLSPIKDLQHLKLLDLFGKSIPAAIHGRHETPDAIKRVLDFLNH